MRVFLTIAATVVLISPSGPVPKHPQTHAAAVTTEPAAAPPQDGTTVSCRSAQPGDKIDDFVVVVPSRSEPKAVASFRLSRSKEEAFDPSKDTSTMLLVGDAEPLPDDPLRYSMHLTVPANVSNGRYYGESLMFISYANSASPSPGDVEFAPTGLELHSLCVEVKNSSYTLKPSAS